MKTVALIPGAYYHIYNRGNNRENIFVEEKNYHYFMKLYALHIEAVAQTYAYCLLRNHFHFLVRIRSEEELQTYQVPETGKVRSPSQAFSNLFNAYARAFNKMYQRSGALFQRPFGRVGIESDAHFQSLIAYIHQNPQKHGFVDDFRDWPFSSYGALSSDSPTRLQRDDVHRWFGGREGFQSWHISPLNEAQIAALLPDDLD
jgi:REP element-mobilizing transposase RayT